MAGRVRPGRRQRGARAEPTAEQFVMQLGPGLCRDAVHAQLAAARSNGEDCDAALARCFAWVVEEFPEEIVLWGLSGGLGEVPWSNANFQRCVRASTLALRDVRGQVVELGMQRDALLAQRDAAPRGADAPAPEFATFAPFVGAGHRLDSLGDLD